VEEIEMVRARWREAGYNKRRKASLTTIVREEEKRR
jgi:hypothetical protein